MSTTTGSSSLINSRPPTDATSLALNQALKDLHAIVPPLWPLGDYVAVNPCLGLADKSFLGGTQLLSHVRNCDLLMSRDYFRNLFESGRLSLADLQTAHAQCQTDHPEWYGEFDLAKFTNWWNNGSQSERKDNSRFHTVAEVVDQLRGTTWSSHIINDITRHCASHFDEGQAVWVSPWNDVPLYTAWREATQLSWRMDQLGLVGFREFVKTLPADPHQALPELLVTLGVPLSHWGLFLLCEVFSVAGWASYLRYRVREAESAGGECDDLVGLLTIRLAYDVALAQTSSLPRPLPLWPLDTPHTPAPDVLGRHTLQVAAEQVYRRELIAKLASHSATRWPTSRKSLQMVSCIDVRSEVMRRHLESVNDVIETFGFAGFFGMPLEYVPLGFEQGSAQCPVLLQPGFQIHERVRGSTPQDENQILRKRNSLGWSRALWKSFQNSATTCFSFVESLGLSYAGKLLSDSLRWTRSSLTANTDGLTKSQAHCVGPDIHSPKNRGLNAVRRLELAEGLLRNLGLTRGFARIVAFCGHAAEVTNNPYRASLDCGACGGHSGEPNARVAAALLNDPDVRIGLAARGIDVSADTWFVAALHNTTTDEIDLCDRHLVPASHFGDLDQIKHWLHEAGRLSRKERAPRLSAGSPEEILDRGHDWAEVRPEWGLAGNAAFIVAPRSRTHALNLGGRSFLHSYDHRLDPDLKVLELILTAPMVVANWINLQYYASAVDPVAFGSGNKLLHNVVGQFGVLQGNGGDLMTGLPWQSVHDGEKLQHEPLRLLVVVDAPRTSILRIIEKHAVVRNLVSKGWVSLLAWEDDQFHRWTAQETWEFLGTSLCSQLPC